jgi:hypothetical protein
MAEDFDAELDRLFRAHIARPAPKRAGVLEGTREWIRARLHDVFYRHRVLPSLQQNVRVEEFTAVIEVEFVPENRCHQFIARLFQAQDISIVPLNRVEKFAKELRSRLP